MLFGLQVDAVDVARDDHLTGVQDPASVAPGHPPVLRRQSLRLPFGAGEHLRKVGQASQRRRHDEQDRGRRAVMRGAGDVSKAEMARRTGLSINTVKRYLGWLEAEEAPVEGGSAGEAVARQGSVGQAIMY